MQSNQITSTHTTESVDGSQPRDRNTQQALTVIDGAIGTYGARGRERFLREALGDVRSVTGAADELIGV